MKLFLVYTAEDHAESPASKFVENCQVLGEVEANCEKEAVEALSERETGDRLIGVLRCTGRAAKILRILHILAPSPASAASC